jgi:hypothetical protein
MGNKRTAFFARFCAGARKACAIAGRNKRLLANWLATLVCALKPPALPVDE